MNIPLEIHAIASEGSIYQTIPVNHDGDRRRSSCIVWYANYCKDGSVMTDMRHFIDKLLLICGEDG